MPKNLFDAEEILLERLISRQIPGDFAYKKEDFLRFVPYIAEFSGRTDVDKPRVSVIGYPYYVIVVTWRKPGFIFAIRYCLTHDYGGFESVVFNTDHMVDTKASINFSQEIEFNSDFVKLLIEEYNIAKVNYESIHKQG